MITFICLWWVGSRLTAPDWYYTILTIGLVVRLFNPILMKKGGEKVKKNKKYLDKTIKLTCRKLQNENMIPEAYTKTLKALAKLVKARASLD